MAMSKRLRNKKDKNRGISIIEILVLLTFVAVGLSGILSLAIFSLRILASIEKTTRANAFAQETMEQIRNFRDGIPWNNNDLEDKYDGLGLAVIGTAYHLEKSADTPSKWMLIQDEEVLPDGYTRKIVFGDVYRDIATDNIESPGGYLDSNTKKITATVSWENKKIEIVTYLTNWK